MAACFGIVSTLAPAVLAARLAGLWRDHPDLAEAVWRSDPRPCAGDDHLPGAASRASLCWRKAEGTFALFRHTLPDLIHHHFRADELVLIDEDGNGAPLKRTLS
jgi:hypothetical protein